MRQSAVIRALDYAIALAVLSASIPVQLLVLLASWVSTGAPIFVQTRVGRGGETFRLYKFRTMATDTPDVPTHALTASRVTKVGGVLRRTKLDELPQLVNVLRGQMSLVGPRPCLPSQVELIQARRALGVLDLLPGITGPAQIRGIDMSEPATLAAIDAELVEGLSVSRYVLILVRTATGGGSGDRVRKEDNG
jgi:lipopolysaccharide/colanic/teichoic acid biosynthesis glycosyltransferase